MKQHYIKSIGQTISYDENQPYSLEEIEKAAINDWNKTHSDIDSKVDELIGVDKEYVAEASTKKDIKPIKKQKQFKTPSLKDTYGRVQAFTAGASKSAPPLAMADLAAQKIIQMLGLGDKTISQQQEETHPSYGIAGRVAGNIAQTAPASPELIQSLGVAGPAILEMIMSPVAGQKLDINKPNLGINKEEAMVQSGIGGLSGLLASLVGTGAQKLNKLRQASLVERKLPGIAKKVGLGTEQESLESIGKSFQEGQKQIASKVSKKFEQDVSSIFANHGEKKIDDIAIRHLKDNVINKIKTELNNPNVASMLKEINKKIKPDMTLNEFQGVVRELGENAGKSKIGGAFSDVYDIGKDVVSDQVEKFAGKEASEQYIKTLGEYGKSKHMVGTLKQITHVKGKGAYGYFPQPGSQTYKVVSNKIVNNPDWAVDLITEHPELSKNVADSIITKIAKTDKIEDAMKIIEGIGDKKLQQLLPPEYYKVLKETVSPYNARSIKLWNLAKKALLGATLTGGAYAIGDRIAGKIGATIKNVPQQ
ncbi:MAG: hypothetical protein KBA02_00290 [Paludibacteraceae bacterium]|nr:hypothetical protein [Paludibacteraceae bacterium]